MDNLVIDMANRAMGYRVQAAELWYRETGDGEVSGEYKGLNAFLAKFEAGSQFLEILTLEGLGELAEEIFGDIVTQTFVLDMQLHLFAPYDPKDIQTVVSRLAFALAVNRPQINAEGGAILAVAPNDSGAFILTEINIRDTLMANLWVLGLLLLSLATEVGQRGERDGANPSVAITR